MIKLEKVYYRDKTRRSLYYTILNDKIYYQNHDDKMSYVVSNKIKHRVLEKSCATHNFTPFIFEGEYYALGCQDSWKHDAKWRGLDYQTFVATFELHFRKPFTREESFYKEIKYKFDTTDVWKHNRGLYLFRSSNGLGWTEKGSEPALTVSHEGFISSLGWKSSEFDGRPSIVKYKDLYYVYVRANIEPGMRKIQYTTTKDFEKFSKFQLIKTGNEDNEYLINVFVYENKMYSFIPSFNEKESYINLYMSIDGKNFKYLNRYFHGLPFYVDQEKPKNKCHSCEGIVEKRNDIFFYIHYNYLGYDESHDVGVLEYSLSKQYLSKL